MSERPSILRRSRVLRALTGGDPVVAALQLLIVVYYVSTRGVFQGKASGDGYFGFLYLPGLFHHGTLELGPVTPYWSSILGREATGRVANACPIGPVLFWMPTYLLGLLLEKGAALVTTLPKTPPGESPFLFWMAGLGSLFAGLAGLGAMFRLLARKTGVGAARFATVAAALATPLVWYLVTQPLYQHACAFFMVTLFVERWDAWRDEPMTRRRWIALGVLGGGAMLMRFQEGIWLLLPGLDAAARAWRALRDGRRKEILDEVMGVALLAATAAVVFAPQLALWKWYFGFVRPPQPPGHMRWSDPAIVGTIFSMRGGLLPWAPILYLVVPGLIAGRRALAPLAWRFGVLLAVEVWVNASAWDHWASWTFGPRRFTDATVVFAAGLAGLWWWARRRGRTLMISFAVFAVAFNFLLMESVRTLRIKSSGAAAATPSKWLAWGKAPPWIGRVFDRTGYPFVQPAGWIYSMIYRVPVRTFEGIVGNYMIERDVRIHPVVHARGISFVPGDGYELWVPEGIAGPAVGQGAARAVPVGKRVRVLVPLFAREPLKMKLTGDFPPSPEVRATWNGRPLAARPERGQVMFDVPAEAVHTRAWTNQVVFDLPDGTRLRRLDFDSFEPWWNGQ